MAVKLNTLSKNGILLGFLGIILHIVMIISAAIKLKKLIDEADENDKIGKSVLQHCGIIVLYIFGIFLCGLFIRGIKRRREWFMLPLLLVILAGGIFVSIATVYDAIKINYTHIDLVAIATAVICLAIIVLYPVCMLFYEIRKENIEERRSIQMSIKVVRD